MRMLKRALVVLFVLYSVPCVLVYLFQEKLLFHPTVLAPDYEYHYELPFEEMDFVMKDGAVINTLHFSCDSSRGIVLYFHGNAGCLKSWGSVAEDFVPNGYEVLVMDYRGFGKSTGAISEQAMFEDGMALYDELLKNYTEDQIIVCGRSIGTGVAAYIASEHNPHKLILETPYYSMKDLAHTMYPVLPTFLLRYPLQTDEYLPKVNCPVYLFHGTNDEVIYYESSVKLKELVPEAELITIEGGGHNNLADFAFYQEELSRILNE